MWQIADSHVLTSLMVKENQSSIKYTLAHTINKKGSSSEFLKFKKYTIITGALYHSLPF
jgi:hypothetical protein